MMSLRIYCLTDYLLIFDFDGTLANSIDAGIKHANSLSKRYKYQPIDNIEIVREQSAVKYIYDQVKWYYLPFWAIQMKRRLKSSANEIPLFPQIDQLLNTLKKTYQLGIISGNRLDYIEEILNRYQLNCFEFIIPNNGAKKHKAIRKLIRSGKESKRMIFIGDDVQDIRSAKQEELKTIAVLWGSSSERLMKEVQADYIVKNAVELNEAISKLTPYANN